MRLCSLVLVSFVVACGGQDAQEWEPDFSSETEAIVTATPCGTAAVCSGTADVYTSLFRASRDVARFSEVAQTFTVTSAMTLGYVNLKLRVARQMEEGESPVLTVSVREVSQDGVPTSESANVSSGTLDVSTLSRVARTASVVMSPTELDPQKTYAIVVSTTAPSTGGAMFGVASHKAADVFDRGAVFVRSGVLGSEPAFRELADYDLSFGVSAPVLGLCEALKDSAPGLSDGMYTLNLPGSVTQSAYCDMTNGGYTLIHSSSSNPQVNTIAAGVVPLDSGTYLWPTSLMTAMAALATTVRIAERGTSNFVESADDYPITRLRSGLILNDDSQFWRNPSPHWTGPKVSSLTHNCWTTSRSQWPNVYWACGLPGLHLLPDAGNRTWGGTGPGPLDVWIK